MIFNPNLNLLNLKYFVYRFYKDKVKYKIKAVFFAEFLKKNFDQFEYMKSSTITGNFKDKPQNIPRCLE